ncbi:MAG: hypothetical protein ACI4TJ_07505 [Candidatus Cryptobacteroides sp.]
MDNNSFDIKELEQLRSDYALLKDRLEHQEIINDRLMVSTFKSKVKDIQSYRWVSYFCGLFVIAVAPFSFHSAPLNLSWWFVGGTDIMMLVCIYATWRYHHDLKEPTPGSQSIKEFMESVKTFKGRYQSWLKYSIPMIIVWFIWMLAELCFKSPDLHMTLLLAASLLLGGTVGGLVGYSLHRKVVSRCDEILSDLDE